MKNFFGLLLVFVIVVYGEDEWSAEAQNDALGLAVYNMCVYTLKHPYSEIRKALKITDPISREVLECVYVNLGFYTIEGGFNVDKITAQIGGDDNVKKTVARCVPQDSDDAIDVQIVKMEECLEAENMGEYGREQ